MPPSTTVPASHPGQVLSIDAHRLSAPSVGGNTWAHFMVDEATGALDIVGSKTKTLAAVFSAIMERIRSRYNAHGHVVKVIHTDAESIYRYLKPAFGMAGIELVCSPPGQHAQRVERYTRTLNERERITRERLPFVLPPAYDLFLMADIAHKMNSLPNSRSFPDTPDERRFLRRTVHHKRYPFLPFGATCMVRNDTYQRSALAARDGIPASKAPVSEAGICMGSDPAFPGDYLFAVASGLVVPRRIFLPVKIIPLGWKPKPTIQLLLPPPATLLVPDPAPGAVPEHLERDRAMFDALDMPDLDPDMPPLLYRPLAPPAPPIPAEGAVSAGTASLASPPAAVHSVPPVAPATPHRVLGAPSPAFSPVQGASLSFSPISSMSALPAAAHPRVMRARAIAASNAGFWCQKFPKSRPTTRPPSPAALPVRPRVPRRPAAASGAPLLSTALVLASIMNAVQSLDAMHSSVAFAAPFVAGPGYTAVYSQPKAATDRDPGFGRQTDMPSDFVPSFSASPSQEMSSAVARKFLDPADMAAAEHDEIEKLVTTYGAVRPIADADIHPDAVRIFCHLLYKEKHEDSDSARVTRVKCRLAANGKRQPADSYGETHASTADSTSRVLAMAAFQAHAIQHGYIDRLTMADFDINGAFLHVPLVSPRQLIMRMPPEISHPLAGQWVEVVKSIYGLKQSNHAFDADLRATILSAGFVSTRDPCIYVKAHSAAHLAANPGAFTERCIVSTHVDDGFGICSHPPFWDDLLAALTARYGTLAAHDVLTSYAGVAFSRSDFGAISLNQRGYILRLMATLGLTGLPPAASPSDATFFHESKDTRPVDAAVYRKLIGILMWLLQTRSDIHKEVNFLSRRVASPTMGDMAKLVRVLRYLNTSPDIGPTFYTEDGPVLCAHVDAAYGVHTDARSHTGYYLSIGRYSAPVFTYSGSQTSCISLGSMMAEYVALGEVAKKILEYRYLLSDLGFPQTGPTVIYEDNKSAINLVNAPAITRKSRHIHIRHHFIRDLVKQGILIIKHLPSAYMTADLLTKPLGPKMFIFLRDILMNRCCLSTPSLPTFPPRGPPYDDA